MKRLILLAAAAAALVTASVAVADGWKTADVSAASATFTATTPTNVRTSTYTCGTQTIEVTTGRWAGTATSTTPDLAGPVELHLKSVYNATKNLGWVDGKLKIRAGDGSTVAHLTGINANGAVDGWLRGHAGRGDGRLFGSLTGTFSKAAGMTAGAIGSGSGADLAVIADGVRCSKSEQSRPSVRLHVRGTVEAVSATAITVKPADGSASQTCTVAAGDDDDETEGVRVGDHVEMTCSQVNGAWVLKDVDRKRRG